MGIEKGSLFDNVISMMKKQDEIKIVYHSEEDRLLEQVRNTLKKQMFLVLA